MADRFEDARGVIQDLLGPVDAVTTIFTRAGHVRGNHVHPNTTQWIYVVSGQMLVSHGGERLTFGDGQLFEEPAAIPHAWRALRDTHVMVFTKGPRSGAAYESDTRRLPESEWLLHPRLCQACHDGPAYGYPLILTRDGGYIHSALCPPRSLTHWLPPGFSATGGPEQVESAEA